MPAYYPVETKMPNNSFEEFIINCCAAKEWSLRKFLKKRLIEAGFSIHEDNYRSRRIEHNSKYSRVHNMLAIRGNPRVCLVAHTDVCRDHGQGKAPDVFPVVKERKGRRIIQDKDCLHQTGGDDRLGVAINVWIALNTGYDMAILLTTDEEIGVISADQVQFKQLMEYDLLVEVDRGNHSNQLVSVISGTKLCTRKTVNRLLSIAEEISMPRKEVNGFLTDVVAIIDNGMAKEAVNMTCGYHDSTGRSNREYIDIEEARDTMKYVSSIIKYYDLGRDKEEKDFVEEIVENIDDEQYDKEERDAIAFFEGLSDTMSIEDYAKATKDIYPLPKLHSKEEADRYIEIMSGLFDSLEERANA